MAGRIPKWVLWGIPLVVAGGGVAALRSRPPQVDVALPVERVVVGSIAVSGRLRGEIETNVGAQVGGRVAELFVCEGSRVTKGQPLARIDDTVLSAQRLQAESAVRTAGNQLRQARRAVQIAEQQRDAARDALATAEAQLRLASRKPLPSEFARLDAETAQ
ncbi:MAG: biotin/lipoyl-binding protein, partial [Armatimonadota bacterium]